MKRSTQTFLALCAGPLLLAMAVSAGRTGSSSSESGDSYDEEAESYAPAPMKSNGMPAPNYDAPIYLETPAPVVEVFEEEMAKPEETPAPVEIKATSAPTAYYVETTSDGGMEKTPDEPLHGDDKGEAPEPEEMQMENPTEGASCSTYDEDVHTASLLDDTCEWDTYMCCWTGHDGQATMYGNADVCRVMDYPEAGDVLELPRDDEGPVYCHGFAWAEGADVDTHILPLYHYVKNVNRTDDGGYYGNVEGAPECGCIEEMPMVDDAACSRFDGDGIAPCWGNSLFAHYKYRLETPKGEMETNLVRECDNHDVPDYDFGTCEHNTYMCCWTENDGQGMADNTDVCYVGDVGHPGQSEGEVHCHGFVWPEDATDKYIHLLAQFVEHFDHRDNRGYFGNLPDAPMCGCIEDMPIVSEADCTKYDDEPGREGKFTACTNNDLRTAFEEEFPGVPVPNLVEECDNKEA